MKNEIRVNRRDALKAGSWVAASAFASSKLTKVQAQAVPAMPAPSTAGPHTLPPLGYGFDALEPYIDAKTMEIHHGKHHANYVMNLNKAIADFPDLKKLSVDELMKSIDTVPEKIRTAVRNHGGGHYNHTLFWKCLKKGSEAKGPQDRLEEAFGELFASKEEGQEAFEKKAMTVFGSGWIWVSVEKGGKLRLETTPNQDNPLMAGREPLLGLDLWEHAYYLKYQNKRLDYVKAFADVLNWDFVQERYQKLTA